MPSFTIIVPCFNEAKRLQASRFISFGQGREDVNFIFVNDGSTDGTKEVLKEIQLSLPGSGILSLQDNKGKGEAVRHGMHLALEKSSSYVGYLDADLSTSLEEFYLLYQKALQKDMDVVLGSRIKKMDTEIERSFSRHIIGRFIATIIDRKFEFGIYDTQCGAKIFKSRLLASVIQQPFFTRWFFDVELLCRIIKKNPGIKAREIPLRNWRNVKNSKISILSFPIVLKEITILLSKY